MGTTLVVNPGSSSRKYALYRDGKSLLELRFEDTNTGFEVCSRVSGTQQVCESIKAGEFSDALQRVVESVNNHLFREGAHTKLDAVAVRVVAPGTFFQKHTIIDAAYLKKLQEREAVAPLHVPIILREIRGIQEYFRDVPIVAVSDSAFHSELPPTAREYSIATEDADKYDIHRFGYHGLSVSSVVRRIHPLIGLNPERMVVCHLGNGASVTAVKNGISVETTMGFSPSTGLPMGSRAGDIDSGALLELMRAKHWLPSDAEMYLNSSGGLAGLAGDSDIRRLLDRRAQGDAAATQALEVFAYHIQKAVAAQTVALGGLDVLALTATAAVRSTELRRLVVRGLAHVGIELSPERNDLLVGKDGVISTRNSVVKVVVLRTDEMGEMARIAAQVSMPTR